MELQQIRYLVALFQERSFVLAAERTHVSQPTLSHQIKKLEEEVGAPLFERASQGVRPTPAGEKFIPYAISILDQLQKGLIELQEESKEISGTISVGAIPTISPYLIPEVLVRLKKMAPRLSLKLYEETTSSLLRSIQEGKIDLGILALPITDSGIVCRSIGKEEFYLAASNKHPLSDKKTISTKSIKEEKLLMLQEGHCFSDQALEYCKHNREDEQIVFQGSSLTSVMKLASVGEGLTLVPKIAVDAKSNPGLRFIPFQSPKPTREIGIAWRVSAPLSLSHRLFMDITEESFKKIVLEGS